MGRTKAGQGHVGHTLKADGSRSYFVKFRMTDPESGNPKQVLKRGFTTEKAASTYLREAQGRASQGLHVSPVRTTVEKYLEDWLAGLRVADTTAYSYRRKMNLYVIPALGSVRLQQLTTRQIDRLYRQLEASGGADGKPLSARTVRYTAMILRKALS
jgi:integrase